MIRLAVIFGTRPEVIKLSPIINDERNPIYELVLISTGQQEGLNDRALEDFSIHPQHSLGLMRPNQTLNSYLSSAISAIENKLVEERIDYVMVHGDTGTALAGALAAFNMKIPVIHIEAGLRSFDLNNPFPEEMNRKLISQLTSIHFAPTENARKNLLAEGINSKDIYVVGNTIVEVVNNVIQKYSHRLEACKITSKFPNYDKNILITVHRRENHVNMDELVSTLEDLSSKHSNWGFWAPVHPNPNVKKKLDSLKNKKPNLHIVDPLDYLEFTAAMKNCDLIVTDSGGVQEEATVLKKYCLVLRKTTERPEVVTSGYGELVPFFKNDIEAKVEQAVLNNLIGLASIPPFGSGDTSLRIRETLSRILQK